MLYFFIAISEVADVNPDIVLWTFKFRHADFCISNFAIALFPQVDEKDYLNFSC